MNQQANTPEEERIIDAAFQDVLQGYLNSNHRKKVEIIERAYKFAKNAHAGVRRRSGEPYILHPIAVARIASQEIGLGSTSICAALLHDVVEDTDYTVEDIRAQFGDKIAQLVEGLTKISGGIFGEHASAQAENFRKLLLTMNDDIRVVLLKMADRLHNMRTLGSMAPNKQYKIAGETLYIYAPLAHRLGLFSIKTELEDLSFKYEHPAAYKEISDKIEATERERRMVYQDFAGPIEKKLNEMGITYDAKYRLKSIYSIWRKMENKKIPFEEVYDLYAMRIIFDCPDPSMEKELSWRIYSAITDIYKLHPDRTRDWISVPKANGYQALHLTVMGHDGNWVEIQIRSRRMDDIAERGFAAHWKYKDGESDEERELTLWIQTIKDILESPEPNAIDFLDTLKLNLFASEIVVFTPKGEPITLPANATVLDLAFYLHSELGLRCIAGKVNHKLVPLNSKLQSGDQVEIITSDSQTPQPEWLNFLATAKARTRLRQALRRDHQPMIEKGRKLLAEALEKAGMEETNELLTKMMGYYHVNSRDDIYMGIARNEINPADSVAAFKKKNQGGAGAMFKKYLIDPFIPAKKSASARDRWQADEDEDLIIPANVNLKETYVLVDDDKTRNYVTADCCNPLPGDDVMGFLEDNGTVTVHSLTCPRAAVLKATYGGRILATRWGRLSGVPKFRATVRIEGIDRRGILREITAMVSSASGIDIRSFNIEATDEVFSGSLTVKVVDADAIDELIRMLKEVNGVTSAARL
ncbi:MAG: bifunctional (p)ppGpp synthetase/guanosine-3',5'-bis(diphosphate) 3'-pyrophosphohydrolase [Bacteroidales bacterium]|nr:bifunctional (p)ppGpp synthetase/guanosine-3',5'-bis(diphosphate) 3'-pyrophosphohydrolase [Bacteroidales bacterium]MBD5282591.1 bifunctional (p)ppGpp synthetase/guanosine-3',5'-bis(diphosphate) 3'-pyrophosphohydrolase [Bacteroides sp.]MBD5294626.1 bifunctional (p)ppGpp synthetase/guanosine-3',5'-bis(diphosphate) 3'-pyrophosphohydrolase [Bacteroides sp.]MBD5343179.1 bifunctional (p)ppGpp synthetase/guanosine-3',5'-bis(diphosphate) 3'-pyrophosphohydrolase [Bacteroides sp.]MBD5362139.1 bifuncti